MDKTSIKNLIAKNQLEEAIKRLLEDTQNTQWHNDVLLQSARLNEYKQLQINGTETPDELERRRNQITHALLSILDGSPLDKNPIGSSKKSNTTFSKVGIIIGVAASIVTIVGFSLKDFLFPKKESTIINATVFVESKMSTDELRKQGYIFMDVEGGERKKELIDDKGTASFQNVKVGDQVKLNVDFSEPFKPRYPDSIYTVPADGRIYLEVELQNLGRVYGTVIWRDQPLPGVLVTIDDLSDTTDVTGSYSIEIPENNRRKDPEVKFLKPGFKMLIKKAYPQTDVPLNIIMEK